LSQPQNAARPTKRCLYDDLNYTAIPSADTPLHTLDHPLIKKAQQQPTERIVEVDDEVLWKVKVGRWRGAAWTQANERWLVAAGNREEGSPDDFYQRLADNGRRWRAEYNASNRPPVKTDTLVSRLLPDCWDKDRLLLEEQFSKVDELQGVVQQLVHDSYLSGAEENDEAGGCELAVEVEKRDLDIYVGIRIVGSARYEVTAVILKAVPGVLDDDDWQLDTRMPRREPRPGEQVWSTFLDRTTFDLWLQKRAKSHPPTRASQSS
jgi:hypothetical protein